MAETRARTYRRYTLAADPSVRHIMKKRITVLVIIVFALLVGAVCVYSLNSRFVRYRNVADNLKDPPRYLRLQINEGEGMIGWDYLIHNDQLYLCETLEAKPIFGGAVYRVWSDESIARFREEHKELERYWPRPEEPDGGLEWKTDLAE